MISNKMNHSNEQNNHQSFDESSQTLSKMYRLYTPHNIIKQNKKFIHTKKISDKNIIELVFPHPNLLFIHPNKIINQEEKHNINQYNLLKNIIERKKTNHSLRKPTTAPTTCYRNTKTTMKRNKYCQKEQINAFNDLFNHDKYQCDPKLSVSTTFYSRKSKILYSKSHSNQTKTSFNIKDIKDMKENIYDNLNNISNEIDLREQKRRQKKLNQIKIKFQEDKLLRDKMYQNGVKSPKTIIYIDMERKFSNHFRKR